MKVYLCGPINGRTDEECKAWREYAKTRLKDAIDPLENDYRGIELVNHKEIVSRDEALINQADALLVYFDRPSVGTAMEVRMAFKELGKPVVVVNASSAPLSPWLVAHATVIFDSMDSAIDYLA